MGAVLGCGPGAVLSHRSAAALWGLRPSSRPLIDVTTSRRLRRRPSGIDTHIAVSLQPRDTSRRRGIPCTTAARTLLDLAGVIDRGGLERTCDQAEALRVLDCRDLGDVLARAGGRRGVRTLRAVLAEREPGRATRSELEAKFLALCSDGGLPRPRTNSRVALEGHSIEVDFLWPQQRLVAEVDGYRFHATRSGFEHDRSRDRRLLIAGYRVVRFTWRQLSEDPDDVIATIRALLHPARQPV
jgi:very-short-patch-repair endonuclease